MILKGKRNYGFIEKWKIEVKSWKIGKLKN